MGRRGAAGKGQTMRGLTRRDGKENGKEVKKKRRAPEKEMRKSLGGDGKD